MATVHDVAKRAGVSPITVSRVINNSGYISAGTRARVETAIQETGYVPNTLARGLRSKRTHTLALVVTDITNPYFTLMARGVEDVAGGAGYAVIYCNTDESETKEEKYANILAQRQVDGVLLVPACGNAKTINFLASKHISVVVLDRSVPGVEADFVRADSENGAHGLTRLLIGLGHEQIALITGPQYVSTAADRVAGYRQALGEAGLAENEQVYYGAFQQHSGYELTLRAMQRSPMPTAIFGANNFILLGIIKALAELKLEVPQDISVVGFDDFPESMLVNPFFTAVVQPAYEMGRLAAELLLKRITGEVSGDFQKIILPTELIERESSGAVPATGRSEFVALEEKKMDLSIEKIDPNRVPKRKLYTGAEIPAVGLGTFGSDRFSAAEIAQAVAGAIDIGYRHIDCAAVYGNEKEIGAVLRKAIDGGLPRQALWITSKLWNNKHAEQDVIPTCKQTLEDLQLDYLDLYLIHWPFPNHHAQGVDVNSRDPHAIPYIHENYMKTWRQLEKLVEMGLVRHIGTSNMTIPKLKLLLRDARIKPAANEMELHPHFQQPELFQFCLNNQLAAIGFSPIGSPTRPERDRTPEDTVDIEDPVIVRIAERLKVHPAVVCIKWAVQRGQIPIPFSVRPKEYYSNLKAAVDDPLTDEEMHQIAAIDKNNRLIKGQVFLWESAKDWQDLWDLDGTIAS